MSSYFQSLCNTVSDNHYLGIHETLNRPKPLKRVFSHLLDFGDLPKEATKVLSGNQEKKIDCFFKNHNLFLRRHQAQQNFLEMFYILTGMCVKQRNTLVKAHKIL